MRPLFTLLFLLFATFSFAQSWLEDNPVWTYSYFEPFTTVGYYKLETVGDTVILGKPCTKLEIRKAARNIYDPSTPEEVLVDYRYVYANADTFAVFIDTGFQVLYDFSLGVGDTLTIPIVDIEDTGCQGLTVSFIVDSVGTVEINGEVLRKQIVHPTVPDGITHVNYYTFIERLGTVSGTISYLILPDVLCQGIEYSTWQFRCYKSDTFPLYQVGEEDCDYIIGEETTSSWLEDNPKWSYSFFSFAANCGYTAIEVTGDTLIQGKLCKILEQLLARRSCWNNDPAPLNYFATDYAYQNGDTLFFFKQGKFQAYYNFSLAVGDTLAIDLGPNAFVDQDSFRLKMVVDSVGTVTINDETLKFQRLRFTTLPYSPDYTGHLTMDVVEKLGPIGGTFNYLLYDYNLYSTAGTGHGPDWTFRCYESDSFPLYHVGEEACDSIRYVDLTFKWFENNPKWTYGYGDGYAVAGYEEITVAGDTIINGQACKKLQLDKTLQGISPPYDTSFHTQHHYAYQEGEAIYIFEGDRFVKLYDMSLQVGDTMRIQTPISPFYDNFIMVLDSMGYTFLNTDLKVQKWRLLNYPTIATLEPAYLIVLEGMGAVQYLDEFGGWYSYFFFPQNLLNNDIIQDAPNWNFRCYQNGFIPLYKPVEEDCTYIATSTTQPTLTNFQLYPNPFTTEITIQLEEDQLETIRIYDITGRLVQETVANGQTLFTFPVVPLAKGLYVLEVTTESGKRGVRRVVR